jgi:hypothetical protein
MGRDAMLDLHIMDIQKPSQKQEVKTACNDQMNFYTAKIAEVPSQGALPIFLYQSDEGPMARYDGLPDRYNINLKCLNPYSNPSQTIYQFAHELGHVFLWPSDVNRIPQWLLLELPELHGPWNNWFVESCCCALAFLSLDEITRKWRLSRRGQQLMSKGNPSEYRHREINESLQETGISKEEVANWIRVELPRLTKECSTNDKKDHKICAMEIEKILREHLNSWGALSHLCDVTDNGRTDFNKWVELVTSEQRPLVNSLDQVFNYVRNG